VRRDPRGVEAGIGEQRSELLAIAEHEGRAQSVGGLRAGDALEEVDLRRECGHGVETAPHRDRHASAGREDAQHLAQRLAPVAEEHQAELADDRVERTLLEGQRLGATLAPFDTAREASGDRQHSRIEVQADDGARRAHALRRLAREHARPARDVEHALAALDASLGDHARRKLPEQRRHEHLLVRIRRIDPLLKRGHGQALAPPPRALSFSSGRREGLARGASPVGRTVARASLLGESLTTRTGEP
jgi:hypothetical protein